MIRADLRFGRLLRVWAPLAATFLLVSGSTPVVNAAINRLPGRDQEADLAAFAVFLSWMIVVQSPLFVTREIAIKMSTDRAGSRRALRFCLGVAAAVSAFELLLGATPLGPALFTLFSGEQTARAAADAFLAIWPAPFFIVVRGVYQAHQIRVDDTLFVGLGTVFRLVATGLIGFVLAPAAGFPGPVLGAVCIAFGVAMESLFAVVRANRSARPPETAEPHGIDLARFALPLMFANFLGVAAAIFYLRIAGRVIVPTREDSLAAYQEVKSLHWLVGAGGMALQSLSTAKVRVRGDARRMVMFALMVGGGLTVILSLAAFTPLRDWILIDLMNEDPNGLVVEFARPALMLAAPMPLYHTVRFCFRGILISRGRTRAITACNVVTLMLLGVAISFELLPSDRNGAFNAYLIWNVAVWIEMAILGRAAFGRYPVPPTAAPPPIEETTA